MHSADQATVPQKIHCFTDEALAELKAQWLSERDCASNHSVRWWTTYNAALTGYLTRTSQPEKAHLRAIDCANLAHGALKP